MKIAYLINQYPCTPHVFIRREIEALERQGVSVSRFSIRAIDHQHELVNAKDVDEANRTIVLLQSGVMGIISSVIIAAFARPVRFANACCIAFAIGWRSDRGLLRNIAYLVEACVLIRWLKQLRVDHLHAHFATNPAAVAMLTRLLGGPPYSFTVHGPEPFDKATILALDRKCRYASKVVAISEFARSQMYRWCACEDWEKIVVVRCGIDETFLRSPPVPPPESPTLLCIGRLHEQKGHLLFLQAISDLLRKGVEHRVQIVGDGPLRSRIESMIETLELADAVELVGWASSEAIRDMLVSSRSLVLPSFAEGLPTVIMEAFALHRPVIATFVGGIPELVKDGVNGWLVAPGSVEELSTAMREALSCSTEHLLSMGMAGASAVAANHDRMRQAEKLKALFSESLDPQQHRATSVADAVPAGSCRTGWPMCDR